jgi:fatty-acyl-CoA synthase
MKENFDALETTPANYVPLSPLSFLKRTADIFGPRTAVVYGERGYTWREFAQRCRRLASALAAKGIGKGDTVSVIAANTPEMLECHYGVPMSGAVLNAINVRLEPATLSYILNHSDAKVLITDTAFSANVRAALESLDHDLLVIDIDDPQGPGGERLGQIDYESLLDEGDPDCDWQGPEDEWDALTLNYTSGTSGRPKGVVYHHRGAYLMSMGTVCGWQLPQHPTYLYTVPLFHCNGWCHAWAMTLMAGTFVCVRNIEAEGIFRALSDHNVSHFGGAPVVLSMLVNAPAEVQKTFDPPLHVMTAGAPPPAAVLAQARTLGFEILHVYGLTETFGHITESLWRDEWNDLDFETQAEKKSWQGVAFPMTESVAVVDLDDGNPVPRDGTRQGEIVIRGNTVMKGYYKDLEATRAAFDRGWFHSGDAAVWHDHGYIQIQDRLKDVIISGGENVSSVEVEGVLYRHHAVAAAAIVAQPHDKWGEVPCAFVELKPDSETSQDELIAFCREHLAGFKTPKRVIFGELPKTATGKIQKFLLRERAREDAQSSA